MSHSNISAFYGEPPCTPRDADIIRGTFWVDFRLTSFDLSDGIPFAPGPPPGYVHENKQTAIIAGMVIVILAIVLPTTARITARLRSNRIEIGSDDWAIILAAIFATAYPCIQIWMVVEAGGGRHSWENTYEDWEKFSHGLGTCRLLFFVTVGLIKISITFFVRRLADRVSRFWRVATDAFLVTLVLYVLAALFWNSLFCIPPRAWFSRQHAGSLESPPICSDDMTNARVFSIIHTIQSFMLLGAPIYILWNVRMDRSKKVRLFAMWACGAVTVLRGVLQLTAFVITNDLFWQYTSILRWTTLDLAMGTLTASLPVLDAYIMGSWHAATGVNAASSGTGQGSKHAVGSMSTNPKLPAFRETASVMKDSDSTENMVATNRPSDDGIPLSAIQTGRSTPVPDREESATGSRRRE